MAVEHRCTAWQRQRAERQRPQAEEELRRAERPEAGVPREVELEVLQAPAVKEFEHVRLGALQALDALLVLLQVSIRYILA